MAILTSGSGVNAEFYADKSERRCRLDVVSCAELFDPVNDKFLNQVGAVGNAGNESGPRNRNSRESGSRGLTVQIRCDAEQGTKLAARKVGSAKYAKWGLFHSHQLQTFARQNMH